MASNPKRAPRKKSKVTKEPIHVKLPRRTRVVKACASTTVGNATPQELETKKKVVKAKNTKLATDNHQPLTLSTHQLPTIVSNVPTSTNFVYSTNPQLNPTDLPSVNASKVNCEQSLESATRPNNALVSNGLLQQNSSSGDPSATTPFTDEKLPKATYPEIDPQNSTIMKVGESLIQTLIKELHSNPVVPTPCTDPTPQGNSVHGHFPCHDTPSSFCQCHPSQPHHVPNYVCNQANRYNCTDPLSIECFPLPLRQPSFPKSQSQYHQGRVFRRLVHPINRSAQPPPPKLPAHQQSNPVAPQRSQPPVQHPQSSPYRNGACFIPWKGKILEPSFNQIRKFGGDLNLIKERVGARDPTPKVLNYKQIRIYFQNQLLTPTPRELLQARGDLHALMMMFPNKVSASPQVMKSGDSRKPSFRF